MTESAPLPSRAEQVTLFEDRAEVCRRAQIGLAAGVQWVRVGGLSLYVDDRSLQARALEAEGVRVLSARVVREVDTSTSLDAQALSALEAAARDAELELRRRERLLQRQGTGQTRARDLFLQWLEALTQIPHTATSPLDAWRRGYDSLLDAERGHIERGAALELERQEVALQLANTRARLSEGRALKTRIEAVAEVLLEAEAAAELELELVYRTPCAQWRPEHLTRLVRDGDTATRGTVELIIFATAWQRTGERWDDVALRFSTARPAQAASAPLIEDDTLRSRRKTSEERRNIIVETRDEVVDAVTGSDAAEMPGVDDGGEPLVLEAHERTSLPSNGQPTRVEVQRSEIDVGIACVLIPERSPVAHLRARGDWSGPLPILAGPARVARGGSLMGRSRLDFVAPGGRFEVGFGPEGAIRCNRTLKTHRDRTAITGTQHLTRTVTLYLSNLSGAPREVHVTERVPVSELSEVTVTVDAPGWEHDAEDGFLTRTVSLGPRAHVEVEAEHTIEARSSVQLPF